MIRSPEIKVNNDVLRILRESSGYTVEEIAKKIKTTVTKVKEVEEGLASFTLTQKKSRKKGRVPYLLAEGRRLPTARREIVYDS